MPTLMYSKKNIELYDFENKILDGRKKHTIRRYRKRPFKISDILYHYKNWRTPKVKKITENICLYVADINIEIINGFFGNIFKIIINKKIIENMSKITELAINDGFNNIIQFSNFFIKSGLPFYGQIIGWVEGIDYE